MTLRQTAWIDGGEAAAAHIATADTLRLAELLARAPQWQAAHELAGRLQRNHAADVDEAARALEAYGAIARDLALARQLAPASRARDFLEDTYARLHAEIHRPAVRPLDALRRLLRDELPDTVRWLRPYIAWVTLLFIGSVLAGAWLVHTYPQLVPLFASAEMIATVERGELWTDSLLNVMPSSVLAVQILSNNVIVSLFAWVLGFLFGLGTLYIIGLNGLMLGGMFAFTALHGLDGRLFEFIVAHGVVELSCICLSGAAGAAVGDAIARPTLDSRAASFAAAARRSGRLLVAITLLLIGCGLIEGYVSPNPQMPLLTRLVVGFGYFALMIALLRGWLFGASRHRSTR
ncbi:MAG: stage II sporulation protein M [Sinobacteraceae bacterium]|nr:stage II sporulation protein M [Nevskiaceae bacterium]